MRKGGQDANQMGRRQPNNQRPAQGHPFTIKQDATAYLMKDQQVSAAIHQAKPSVLAHLLLGPTWLHRHSASWDE
jgi:hypothetical protein